MWLALFFVAPMVALFVIHAVLSRHPSRMRRGIPLLALLPAVVAAVGVTYLVSQSNRWRGGTGLAWVGVDSMTPGDRLTLGGDPYGSGLGWPEGHTWPQVTVAHGPTGTAIEVRGGGGLVEIENRAVNGDALGAADREIRGFRLRVIDRWWPLPDDLQIRPVQQWTPLPPAGWRERLASAIMPEDPDPPLAMFPLRRPASGVLSISDRVARTVLRLRQRAQVGDHALALSFEEWATAIRLAILDDNVRVLDEEDRMRVFPWTSTAEGIAVTVRWPRRILRANIWRAGDRVHLGFVPPWRTVSPLPDVSDPAAGLPLTLTNSPVPGDYVFALPFGSGTGLRAVSPLVTHPQRGVIFGDETTRGRNILVPPGTPRDDVSRRFSVDRVQSTTCVNVGTSRPCLGVVQDVLDRGALIEALIVSLLCLGLGLLAAESMVHRLRPVAWTLALLIGSFWSLLALRLLLALRYAIDPVGLDRIAVEGVVNATVALTVVPACLAGAAAVYLEQFVLRDGAPARHRLFSALGILGTILGLGLLQGTRIVRLWPNLPDAYNPGLTEGAIALVAMVGLAGLLSILFFVALDVPARARWTRFDALVNFPVRFLQIAGDLWVGSESIVRKPRYWLSSAVVLAVVIAGFWLAAAAGGGLKLATELLYPLIVGMPLVMFWIGGLHGYPPGANLERDALPGKRLLVPALLFAIVPGVAPIAFNDPGALYSMLGILALTGMLLLGSRHPRFGGVLLASSFAVIGLAIVSVITVVTVLPTKFSQQVIGAFDRGTARVVAHVESENLQRMLPLSRALSDTGSGLPAEALRGAQQHPWESGAITYRGGWWGLGFGASPTRNSNIPQDVLQYDSTISFFVAGDHGLAGVFSLFLLYLMPLATLTIAARRHFDTGVAVAIVAAGWLVVEAVVHTSVNFGILPFTGRNLPWLSVKSSSDLLRWTAMAALMVYGELWRSNGTEFGFRMKRVTLVVPPATTVAGAAPPQRTPLRWHERLPAGWLRDAFQPVTRPLTTTGSIIALMLGVLVATPGILILHNHAAYGNPFTWKQFFDEVQMYLDEGRVRWNAETWELDPSPLRRDGVELDGSTLLEQEIARFNAMARDDKSELPGTLQQDLRALRTTRDYDRMLQAAARREAAGAESKASLFRVVERTTLLDDGTAATEAYPVVDRTRDSRVSFDADVTASQLPVVRFRPDASGQPAPHLIGPAWVSGRWRTAWVSDGRVPWVETLAIGVRGIWGNRALDDLRERFGTVTLDVEMQRIARDFVATKGRERHGWLLGQGAQRDTPVLGLPPRVALAILALPSGEALALGGWPALSASGTWQESPEEGVMPPARWLRERAPRALTYRYVGDRNFDPIEMGSATKPLWAAAALKIHPRLSGALSTQGPEESEREVFGIPITTGKGWTTHARGWTSFRQYMASSDNRYHVRLGFAALAQDEAGLPATDRRSASLRESISLRGGPTPWRWTPRFEPAIGFTAASPSRFHSLQTTRAAATMKELFGISILPGDLANVRRSFWSLDENDDWSPLSRSPLPGAFGELSPVIPSFQLNAVSSARQYVNLLLGGGTNRWANADFAAAFATAVVGHPVLAHAVPGQMTVSASRTPFREVALPLREALRDVVTSGTARGLAASEAWFRGRRVMAYAKTGTLSTDGGTTETSRLVVALIRWRDETRGEVDRGLVLSLVAERADVNFAALWLGGFIDVNREMLLRRLNDSPTAD